MARPGIRGDGYDELVKRLKNHKSFQTSGSFSGVEKPTTMPDPGYLCEIERNNLRSEWEQLGIAYVVKSYGTPIAWVTTFGNHVHIVNQKFSVTTSRHQGFLYHLEQKGK